MSIALVQEVFAYTAAGGSANKAITIAAPGAGNALRLLVQLQNDTSVTGVTGGGVTWTKLADLSDSSATTAVQIWGGDSSSGSGTTVTVTVTNTYRRINCNVTEWSGMPATAVPDPAPATNTGTSGTATTAGATPSAGQEVLLLAVGGSSGATITNTPSGGFTALSAAGGSGTVGYGYLIVASASGSYSTGWANAPSYAPWAALVAGWDGAGGGGDTTAPVLSSPVGTTTGSTTATIGATTDEGNGTLYGVVTTSNTQPSVAQIKAGQTHTGAAAPFGGTTSVGSTGAKTISATGLTASTAYYAHLVHADAAGNDSNRVTSAQFTTDAAADVTPPTAGSWAAPSAGTTITATLSESGCVADGGGTSGTGGFTLTGGPATVSGWGISGTTLTLSLTNLVYQGEVVTVAYARAGTTDDIKDAAGNFLADISATAVTNNSTQTGAGAGGNTYSRGRLVNAGG